MSVFTEEDEAFTMEREGALHYSLYLKEGSVVDIEGGGVLMPVQENLLKTPQDKIDVNGRYFVGIEIKGGHATPYSERRRNPMGALYLSIETMSGYNGISLEEPPSFIDIDENDYTYFINGRFYQWINGIVERVPK